MQVPEHSLSPLSSSLRSISSFTLDSCSQDAYELGLVAQYLDLNQDSTISDKQDSPKQPSCEATMPSSIEAETSNKGNSTFHNFQKHIITTLKQNVKVKKTSAFEGSKLRLAYELWQYVTSSSKTSKKWLLAVLGNNLQLSREIINDPRWGDLRERVVEAGEAQVSAAQDYLRGAIVRQAQGMLTRKMLKGRRIQRLEEFTLYFQEFISELEEGVTTRRLPKLKRQEIETRRRQDHPV